MQTAGSTLLKEKLAELHSLQKPLDFPETLLHRIVSLSVAPLSSSSPPGSHLQSLFDQLHRATPSSQHLPALLNLPYISDYSDQIKQPLKKLVHYVTPAELMEELLQNSTASVQGFNGI